ncbi:MAG: hypothetical protein BWY76_00212 [bacterium ADurb.Bin429]|nr:MAG: hypothetical protein BWY76_00212 [bacterium ADurb.Bin429]
MFSHEWNERHLGKRYTRRLQIIHECFSSTVRADDQQVRGHACFHECLANTAYNSNSVKPDILIADKTFTAIHFTQQHLIICRKWLSYQCIQTGQIIRCRGWVFYKVLSHTASIFSEVNDPHALLRGGATKNFIVNTRCYSAPISTVTAVPQLFASLPHFTVVARWARR